MTKNPRGIVLVGWALVALLWAVPAAGIVLTDSLPPAEDLLLPFGLRTVGTSMNQIVLITNDKARSVANRNSCESRRWLQWTGC